MRRKRAVIFTNGDLPDPEAVRAFLHADDYLIAADGGLKHMDRLHLRPHLLIGDMDSVEPSRLQELRNSPVEILRFPIEKDESDLELALQAALDRGFKSILIVAATGGRLDQTLGNIALLFHVPVNVNVQLESGSEEILLCRNLVSIHGQPGDIVSLIPWGTSVKGVTTSGLKFTLKNETLLPDKTRGISNVMLRSKARIQITDGSLICIHTRKSGGKQ
jgi:thiamine pyrophosphokinase